MRRLAIILIAVILTFNFSGCFTLVMKCARKGESSSSDSVQPIRLQKTSVTIEQVNSNLSGLQLSEMFKKFDELTGYAYGDDFQSFVFIKNSPAKMNVEVIPHGKEYGGDVYVQLGESVTINGLSVKYKINRKRHEDFYSYKTIAVVSGGGDKVYVRYEYTSRSSECELLRLIEALFIKRGD